LNREIQGKHWRFRSNLKLQITIYIKNELYGSHITNKIYSKMSLNIF